MDILYILIKNRHKNEIERCPDSGINNYYPVIRTLLLLQIEGECSNALLYKRFNNS